MINKIHVLRLAILGPLILLTACGFEGFIGRVAGHDHPQPDGGTIPDPQPAIVTGRVPATSIAGLDARDLEFFCGPDLLLATISVNGEEFSASFPVGKRYSGLLVSVERGTQTLRAVVAEAVPGETVMAGDFDGIDNFETAASLFVEAKASAANRALNSYPADTLQAALVALDGLSASGNLKIFYDMVSAIAACTDCQRGTAGRFRAPVLSAAGQVVESGLHPDFILANPVDYDNDGQVEDTTEKFDAAMSAALGAYEFKACYCDEEAYYSQCDYERPMIPVVLAVDMNVGNKDGNCDTIDRFLWAEDAQGAGMFVAAGIHPDSPIQDNQIEQQLGAWVPNSVAMYDDGSHGDEKAADGIWTLTFEKLPVGLRIGYKYTWGRQGDNWGGTEEWPGNRRILEIVDVNGDHIVARFDNFGDETSNKDVMNRLLPANGGNGTVDWETDANSDGVLDARERRRDSDSDCIFDSWWTPSAVLALTTPCP
ncbi:MAG: hypothetical protein JRJ87_06135 [Deltaproteobacteria bacterium]|nr:hypothetical protein [Deltaproteobacteria bacterium]